MNMSAREIFSRALVSGSVAALTSAAVASWCGRKDAGHAAGPLNAVSHIAWGGSARSHARDDGVNTVVGFALHHGASIFWALGFEAVFGRRAERSVPDALIGGAATAATAYVVDYHLVPERFVPGFEARLKGGALFYVYAALALGLAATAQARAQKGRAFTTMR